MDAGKMNELAASQPSWAAWIEIKHIKAYTLFLISRSPLGLRGLKFFILPALVKSRAVAALLGCVD